MRKAKCMRLAAAVISALLTVWTSAASAEVLAVCAEPHSQPETLVDGLGITPTRGTGEAQLALIRDTAGFDIVLNWGELAQHSMRAEGADILGDQLDESFIHLLVARADGKSLEHFLFSLEYSKPGELLWSASGDTENSDSDTVTLASACVKPK